MICDFIIWTNDISHVVQACSVDVSALSFQVSHAICADSTVENGLSQNTGLCSEPQHRPGVEVWARDLCPHLRNRETLTCSKSSASP